VQRKNRFCLIVSNVSPVLQQHHRSQPRVQIVLPPVLVDARMGDAAVECAGAEWSVGMVLLLDKWNESVAASRRQP
jgi:hypothetical protein